MIERGSLSPRALIAAMLVPQAATSRAADDAFESFQQGAQVQTASRRAEAVWQAPMAVEIVTAEEIRASGAVNLWDFMRFRAGMNMVDGRAGLSVRFSP